MHRLSTDKKKRRVKPLPRRTKGNPLIGYFHFRVLSGVYSGIRADFGAPSEECSHATDDFYHLRIAEGWLERRDVRAAVNLLLSRGFSPGRIGIHSGSYGAAAALLSTAAIPEVGAVVADSAFADVRDLMDAQIEDRTGIPAWVARFFLRPGNAFVAQVLYPLDLAEIPPERAVPAIAPRPILFIHGSDDPTIPVEHAYRLKAASKNPADELWILEGYGHTEGVQLGDEQVEVSPLREEYLRRVSEFFVRSLP